MVPWYHHVLLSVLFRACVYLSHMWGADELWHMCVSFTITHMDSQGRVG